MLCLHKILEDKYDVIIRLYASALALLNDSVVVVPTTTSQQTVHLPPSQQTVHLSAQPSLPPALPSTTTQVNTHSAIKLLSPDPSQRNIREEIKREEINEKQDHKEEMHSAKANIKEEIQSAEAKDENNDSNDMKTLMKWMTWLRREEEMRKQLTKQVIKLSQSSTKIESLKTARKVETLKKVERYRLTYKKIKVPPTAQPKTVITPPPFKNFNKEDFETILAVIPKDNVYKSTTSSARSQQILSQTRN